MPPKKKARPSAGSEARALHALVLDRLEALGPDDRTLFASLLLPTLEELTTLPPPPETAAAEARLGRIQEELRREVPVNGLAPEETLRFPSSTPEGYAAHNTAHVDGFLYGDEDLVDALCEEGHLHRHYCLSTLCGHSRDVRHLHFISHSFSVAELAYVFHDALRGEVDGRVVVDVGSRLGAVLYYGALFTKAERLIGIELSPYFVALQERTIQSHNLSDRAEVLAADVFSDEGSVALSRGDIVILNNVFEWFTQDQRAQYVRLRAVLNKKGTILITNPPLEDIVDLSGPPFDGWVRGVPLTYSDCPSDGANSDDSDDELASLRQFRKYVVL
jgi:hypothetical protein